MKLRYGLEGSQARVDIVYSRLRAEYTNGSSCEYTLCSCSVRGPGGDRSVHRHWLLSTGDMEPTYSSTSQELSEGRKKRFESDSDRHVFRKGGKEGLTRTQIGMFFGHRVCRVSSSPSALQRSTQPFATEGAGAGLALALQTLSAGSPSIRTSDRQLILT